MWETHYQNVRQLSDELEKLAFYLSAAMQEDASKDVMELARFADEIAGDISLDIHSCVEIEVEA